MNTQIIVSGEAYGFGSDKWRGVTRLSAEAKSALNENSALVICPRPFNDRMGNWYVVENTRTKSKWNHRLPNEAEEKQIQNM